MELSLTTVGDYTYTYDYIFEDDHGNQYEHSISGTLSVKACGEIIPSGYMNMNTNSGTYSVDPT